MTVVLAVIASALGIYVAKRGRDGFPVVQWTTLSGFKYDTHEVLNDVDGGRPFTRSNDIIPPNVKALNGRPVTVTGFLMPLRLKKGLVTEFLLFKDQASCCFGPAAKMNHYIRVKMRTEGFPPPGGLVPYRVRGVLQVGEINVQGYLTGIYQLEAEKVVEQKS
jgi:hypothetical protein